MQQEIQMRSAILGRQSKNPHQMRVPLAGGSLFLATVPLTDDGTEYPDLFGIDTRERILKL